jgi:hypothetical protein
VWLKPKILFYRDPPAKANGNELENISFKQLLKYCISTEWKIIDNPTAPFKKVKSIQLKV